MFAASHPSSPLLTPPSHLQCYVVSNLRDKCFPLYIITVQDCVYMLLLMVVLIS